MTRGTVTATVASLAMLGLAACSSSGSPAAHSSSRIDTPATRTETVSAATPAQVWDDSLCSKLDPAKVAKAAGPDIRVRPARKSVTSDIAVPTFDVCTIALRRGTGAAKSFDVRYGLSAITWSRAEWTAYTKSRTRAGAEKLQVAGHEAIDDLARGRAHLQVLVGDRILTVVGPSWQVKKRIIAELELAIPVVRTVKPRPDTVAAPACGRADRAVTAALGAPATVRRDSGSGGELTCGWATRTAYVRVHADGGPAAWPQVMKSMQQRWPDAQPVHGVGEGAVYTKDRALEPPTLRVATKQHLVFVQGAGAQVDKAALIDVAKQVIDNY